MLQSSFGPTGAIEGCPGEVPLGGRRRAWQPRLEKKRFHLDTSAPRFHHSTTEKLMAAEGQELAIACAKAAEEILAEDIHVLDLRGVSSLTDYMLVCSGSSMPHLKAILREVEVKVREWSGADPLYSEGKADSRWVVLDYVDVMVHIMHQEMRELYALEELWGDAKIVEWEPNRAPSK